MLFAFLHSFFYRCIVGVSRGSMACVDMFTLIFIVLRERGREGGREREKHQCVVASHMSPTGDLACNPSMCPDWESNR